MNKQELQQRINEINWFHSIDLPHTDLNGGRTLGTIRTPGIVDHCTEELATKRFGIPTRLMGASILDVGAYDGYFSFLAERRGAHRVIAIDNQQDCSNLHHTSEGIGLAIKALNSKVRFNGLSLAAFATPPGITISDVSFYFGVLYHVDNPFKELQHLRKVTRWYALIETACIHTNYLNRPRSFWQLRPGCNGDGTNVWYPTIPALIDACTAAGFQMTEIIHVTEDRTRCTIKAYC